MENYAVFEQKSLPNIDQLMRLSTMGTELVSIINYKGKFFIYLKRIKEGQNTVTQGCEYKILEDYLPPTVRNLNDLSKGGLELIQLISIGDKIVGFFRRPVARMRGSNETASNGM